MIVYAESSAVVAWLLDEARGNDVQAVLAKASRVVASRLTRLECLRAIVRREAEGRISRLDAERTLDVFARASAHWGFLDVGADVLDRGAGRFPEEPVRSLDAIHLATLLMLRPAIPDLEALALDDRVRRNATRLGIPVQPS